MLNVTMNETYIWYTVLFFNVRLQYPQIRQFLTDDTLRNKTLAEKNMLRIVT